MMEKRRGGLVGPSAASVPQPWNRPQSSHPEPSRRHEGETKDPAAARKVQKADREKLRRDRLNEHFIELSNALDPDKPKNDKATILTDAVQVLKDLTVEVSKLKAEYVALTEESQELTQEKNELKEEKATIKSEIESINIQYQQRLRVMFPWSATDMPVIMAPQPYPYPVPMAVPPGPIPMHASPMQAFPYFGSQNPTTVPTPCSIFPYSSPVNPTAELPSIRHTSSSYVSSQQSRSPDHERIVDDANLDEDSNNVATYLELKMPGMSKQEVSSGEKRGQRAHCTESSVNHESSSNRILSSTVHQDNSSCSVGDIQKSST